MVIAMGWREAGMGKSESESCSVLSDSLQPSGPYSPWNSPVEFHYGVGSLSVLGDFSNPGIEATSPTLQADSLPAEPPEKPKNTGVGSLSLLQWMFPTQESNQGVLHCRWILYQLSYRELVFNENRVSGKMKKFPREKVVWLDNNVNYLMPQNYTLEKQHNSTLYVMCFLKPRTFN